jgi:hypothetical protein
MEKIPRGTSATCLLAEFCLESQSVLETTLSEVAGIKIEGQNKWVTVMQNASQQSVS